MLLSRAFVALVLLSVRKSTVPRIGAVAGVALSHALPVAVMVYVGRVSTVDTVKVVNDLRLFDSWQPTTDNFFL